MAMAPPVVGPVGALVVEIGACHTKIGHAGTTMPPVMRSSLLGYDVPAEDAGEAAADADGDVDMGSATTGKGAGSESKDESKGDDAGGDGDPRLRSGKGRAAGGYHFNASCTDRQLALKSPYKDNELADWDMVHAIMEHAYQKRLHTRPEEHPVMVVQNVSASPASRKHWCEVVFDSFNAPAIFTAKDAALTCYANARTSGLVLDCGLSSTRVVPVEDGYVLQPGYYTSSLGGAAIESYYLDRLQTKLRVVPPSLPVKTLRGKKLHPSFLDHHTLCTVRDILGAEGRVSESAFDDSMRHKIPAVQFNLPDGRSVPIDADRFQMPELLFNPEPLEKEHPTAMSLQDLVMRSVLSIDIGSRKDMFYNILLAGGNSVYQDISTRLAKEVSFLAGAARVRVPSSTASDRKMASWVGGSILGSLSGFHDMWVTRAEYLEHGASILERKCP